MVRWFEKDDMNRLGNAIRRIVEREARSRLRLLRRAKRGDAQAAADLMARYNCRLVPIEEYDALPRA